MEIIDELINCSVDQLQKRVTELEVELEVYRCRLRRLQEKVVQLQAEKALSQGLTALGHIFAHLATSPPVDTTQSDSK